MPSHPLAHIVIKAALLLAFGSALGGAAEFVGLPLPWMIGPLVGTAALSLFGLPVAIPVGFRKLGQLLAAVAIGTTFTEPVLAGLVQYLPVIVICAITAIALGMAVGAAQAHLTGTTFKTGYFASMPGGVAEMSVMAERYGGETALVALAQSLRIIIVVLTVPFLLTLFHAPSVRAAPHAIGWDVATLPPLGTMIALSVGLGWVLDRFRTMNAYFLAGLGIAILAMQILPTPPRVPTSLLNAAQVMLGVALGGRMDPGALSHMRRFLPATAGSTFVLIIGNAGVALVLSLFTDIDLETLLLATTPGGVAEMSLTAAALNLAAGIVTAFHLMRIFLIITLSDPLFRLCLRLFPSVAR